MKAKDRIHSIIKASALDSSITGMPSFELSELDLRSTPNAELPENLRLGHLAEKAVAELIKASTNFTLLYENIQIIQANNTIGELDFIVQNLTTRQVTHVELAYKFYLFDPSLSDDSISCWIGPNRNDSLIEKMDKLKQKQFPLLYHASAKTCLPAIDLQQTSQALCLLASLYVPYGNKTSFGGSIKNAIKGHYVSFDLFKTLDTPNKTYYLPSKKEWGIEPAHNNEWATLSEVEHFITVQLAEKRAVLIWQKKNEEYTSLFTVWW